MLATSLDVPFVLAAVKAAAISFSALVLSKGGAEAHAIAERLKVASTSTKYMGSEPVLRLKATVHIVDSFFSQIILLIAILSYCRSFWVSRRTSRLLTAKRIVCSKYSRWEVPTEFCILGLLMLRPMTIYELSMAFKATLGLFYSASLGSLQVAVRNLKAKGFVAMEEVRFGKRVRKVYTILEGGRQVFFAEMVEPIPETKLEVVSLARLHFLGLLPSETRSRVKTIIIEAIEASLSSLLAKRDELAQLRIPPDYRPIFNYQVKTLEYGIMSHTAALGWFKSLGLDGSEDSAGTNRQSIS